MNDIRQWEERNEIVLQPKFQRRRVWNDMARSYLIDTIIRGKPIPKLFIRQKVDMETMHTIREVVDGQQRLTTILAFLKDEITIKRAHSEEYAGRGFSQLPENVKKDFLEYELAFDLLPNATDEEVLDIFARLNTYSVTLNQQEKLNATFFGAFKTTSYALAFEFNSFWLMNRIFTERRVVRMAEAELTSDLLIAMIEGIHSKKAIKKLYEKYDEHLPDKNEMMKQFRHTMDTIGEILGPNLSSSNFRRVQVFYSLFCALYHLLYGLKRFDVERRKIHEFDYECIRLALDEIDGIWNRREEDRTQKERDFINWCSRATTDAPVRAKRTEYICRAIVNRLG